MASTTGSEGRVRKRKNSEEAFMRQSCNPGSSLPNWLIACFVLVVCIGMPQLLIAGLVTQDEVNSVRVYKQMAKSTVLVASAYVSSHHITQASGKGLGSGILIDEAGTIVTNAHVVAGAAKITVTLHDGTRLPAKLIGSDPQTDIALLQVSLPKGPYVPAALGDSDKLKSARKWSPSGTRLVLPMPFQRAS